MGKIAISGTEGTGKTTLASEVSKRYGVPVIPEFARDVAQEMGIKELRKISPEKTLEFQKAILSLKKAEEAKHTSFIADRSTADNMAYYLRWCARDLDDKCNEEYVEGCRRQLKTYDLVVILPWDVIPLERDGFRTAKRYYQYEMQCTILGILMDHGIPHEILREPDLNKRVEFFGKFFNRGEKNDVCAKG